MRSPTFSEAGLGTLAILELLNVACSDDTATNSNHVKVPMFADIPPAEVISNVESNAEELLREEIESSYSYFFDNFVSSEGTSDNEDQLRVIVDEKDRNTVSEGMGYAMRIIIEREYATPAEEDQARVRFQQLWNYVNSNLNENGLMMWNISANGEPLDTNSATDGDIDIAVALILANQRWGILEEEAHAMVNALMEHDVEAESFILKPGDSWGGADELNPSYFDPAAFELFYNFTENEAWMRVSNKCYLILGNLIPEISPHGFIPEWMTASGDPVADRDPEDSNMEYNGVRIGLRLGRDINNKNARIILNLINDYFEKHKDEKIIDGYTLSGGDNPAEGENPGQWNTAPFRALAAIASLLSDDPLYEAYRLSELLDSHDENYYNEAQKLMALELIYNIKYPTSITE